MIETILIFIIVLAVLIFVHELGHFLFARLFKIRVDEFAIGFGPKLWSQKFGQTVYAVNAIPFGGYVKIYGEDGEGTGGNSAHSDSFAAKPGYIQAIVLFAGILFNFLFAWIIVSGGFMAGMPVPTDDYSQYASRFRDERVIVGDVSDGSPAAKAGIVPGDTLVSVSSLAGSSDPSGVTYSGSNFSITNLQSVVSASDGKPVAIGYISVGEKDQKNVIIADVTPVKGIADEPDQYAVGISMDNAATLSLPFFSAFKEGAKYTYYAIEETVIGVGTLITAAFHHDTAVLSQVSGPVGIASLVGQAVATGFANLILLTAVISVNLGVLNFIPFPALDGGRILFVIIEAIIRRPIKPSTANAVNTVGFCLLILLMVIVTWHDIIKLI